MAHGQRPARSRGRGRGAFTILPIRGRKQNGGETGLLRKIASIGAGPIMLCASRPVAADEPQKWTGPFGGTFTATFAFVSQYSFSGISQTRLHPALPPCVRHETSTVLAK